MASSASAELVLLDGGDLMKVGSVEVGEERVHLVHASGGRMSLPIARIEHVVDDEMVPVPGSVAGAEIASEAGGPLVFDEAAGPLPSTPPTAT